MYKISNKYSSGKSLAFQAIQYTLMILRYVTAFGELAKSSTTMLLPGNPSDVGSAVAQAMAIYGKVFPCPLQLSS